ncbi:ArsR/SmtB family transcription factor [Microbulbifer variabilis]|jgi:ArsR family transcriptional regulator|uniref:Metalloregulator ArsR/SmtB family transcription factor n=1 Tax=Microbulbifer variabilis TaxID=266805 RepID=A0ABY4VCI3_9GAMM|nr:metalloregulator ArsR/SmtB family transcription factor [Microbulbifer variabilis]USD20117.1 metalloregulator ArsR/SmtB family transcription factor [Microbulbifer variabilis]
MPDTTNLDLDKMRDSAGQAAAMLRSLANQDRLLLLCQLSQEELNVGELEERLGLRQPSLSQQLGVLRREGLVDTRREGKHVYYRVADPRVMALLQTLYQLYCAE